MIRKSGLLFLSLLFLFNVITVVGVKADITGEFAVSGFALLDVTREKDEHDSIALGQFRVIVKKGLFRGVEFVAKVLPNAEHKIHHLYVRMTSPIRYVDEILVGQSSPPVFGESCASPASQEAIGYPDYTRFIVPKDVGILVKGTPYKGVKLWLGAYGADTRVGGLLEERDSGNWHIYQRVELQRLDSPFLIGVGHRYSDLDLNIWTVEASWITKQLKLVAELLDSEKGTYYGGVAAYSVTPNIRAVLRYERTVKMGGPEAGEKVHSIIPGVSITPFDYNDCEVKVNFVPKPDPKLMVQFIVRFF